LKKGLFTLINFPGVNLVRRSSEVGPAQFGPVNAVGKQVSTTSSKKQIPVRYHVIRERLI
jgi:hypothetical protein